MIAKFLKEARENKGLTQKYVANCLYVTRQTVSRWEQGKTLPNIYVLQKLSDLYGVSIERLINDDIKEQRKKNINYFALFGSMIFNVFLFFILILSTMILVIGIWGLSLIFTFSPFIFLLFVYLHIQNFEIVQLLLCIFFLILGLIAFPIIKNLTKSIIFYLKVYLKYNHKTIFY